VPGFTLFVSDLHLAAERPPATQAFFSLLAGPARQADALYILGDLFEYWAGDDDLRDPFNASVAAALRGLADAGVPSHFLHGNRDFLVLGRFARAAGIRLIPDPTVVDLYGTRTVLMHGDTLCTDDKRYQAFRKRVRSRWLQRAFLLTPLSFRRGLFERTRRVSELEKRVKTMDIMDVNAGAVAQAFREQRCTRMIHGHTHRPARHVHEVDGETRERWVLSDWYTMGQYLRVNGDGCESIPIAFDC
jgi:UDP-2,3-diacylglucosamine hydrolase